MKAAVIQGERGELRRRPDDPGRVEAYLPAAHPQNHAASLMLLNSGDLACVWFSGTQEGAADISIYFSRLAPVGSRWSAPVKLSDDPTRSEQNPVLFPAPDGRLWLLYTAQKAGNQDTAIVRRRISGDNGWSWGPIETLFGTRSGAGTYVRQPIVVLNNGDWLLPVFYCQGTPGRKWVGDQDVSAVKISSDQGTTWVDHAVPNSTGYVHMNVEKLGDGTLLALFRSRWADQVHASRSRDHGRTWSEPVPTELPNNNSSIQFTRLANGHLAIVYNDVNARQGMARRASLYDEIEEDDGGAAAASPPAVPGGGGAEGRTTFWGVPRAPLTIAVSMDGGRTWPHKRDLEVGDGYCMTNNSRDGLNREYSYPSIKQSPDGDIHIAFTYFRQAIKYVRIKESWIMGDR